MFTIIFYLVRKRAKNSFSDCLFLEWHYESVSILDHFKIGRDENKGF